MLTYCILKNDSNQQVIVAKTGFSIFAFILGPIWAIFNQLWVYAGIGVLVLIATSLIISAYKISFFFLLLSISSSFFWGAFARDLYIQNLIKKNFRPLKHIHANSEETAIVQYLSEENK